MIVVTIPIIAIVMSGSMKSRFYKIVPIKNNNKKRKKKIIKNINKKITLVIN